MGYGDEIMATHEAAVLKKEYPDSQIIAGKIWESHQKEIFKNNNVPTRVEVMEQMIPYIKEQTKKGTRLNQIMRHTIGLFHGQRGSSYWKRYLSDNMCIREADLQKVNHIMDHIKKNNLTTSLER